jgi:glycosyltransferase involved in cell wall biosynthesis
MPVANEVDVIEGVLAEWLEKVVRHLPAGSELVLDDASSDGTEIILARLARQHAPLRVLFQAHKDGFFKSAMRLYRAARCPLVFFTDSDGQYVPDEFWKLVPHISKHDIVHGYKVARQDPFYRCLASGVFNSAYRWMFASSYQDINSAFRLLHRRVLDRLLPKISHMPTLLNAELLIRAEQEGFTIRQVGVRHRPRRYGKSRGLPPGRFVKESCLAFRGLVQVKKEYGRAA